MLKDHDQEIFQAIEEERKRQMLHIELIASENFVSDEVLEAAGSILTNKYAEGYPGKRYYGGCEYVDVVENLAKERLKKLFNVRFVNVQPHSGSQANMAAYRCLIHHHDRVMGMALDHGGHLTHGHALSFSGIDYEFHPYFVDAQTGMINYDEVERIAMEVKPKLIVAGASAYARIIDFKRFSEIAKKTGAYLMVDMAHIAGLVATGLHPSPVPYADIVTSTTHKTLRGPRGGIMMTNNEEIAKEIDRTIFPGIQGGPLMHIIAAKAVAFKEALEPSFVEYQKRIIENARTLAEALKAKGFILVTGGTDNHMMLVDVKKTLGMTGKQAERILDSVYITCNKNTVPFDTEKPMYASGIRLGTPAITTRGFGTKEVLKVAELIDKALRNNDNEQVLEEVRTEVRMLTSHFPLHNKNV